ncbi:MAG TPA: RDD family protein [Candidatus Dormibacteraeota bacterium]|nr:RDD family protein [Candidatus Dormibacteraeota bacterium]
MRVVTWDGGTITTSDSVEVGHPVSGAQLRDAYVDAVSALTLGIVRFDRDAVRVGPVELLKFGEPRVETASVEWPIEGGLLARGGGRWRIESKDGTVAAAAIGHRPALPRPLYDITHLQVHLLATRLYLLRLRGTQPALGIEAPREDRVRAAAVDIAFCLTLARLTGRRRAGRVLLITAAYHVACWSTMGRTLGGVVMRERVVALDGSRPTVTQSMFRFALLPLSWLGRGPVHDELAATTVVKG